MRLLNADATSFHTVFTIDSIVCVNLDERYAVDGDCTVYQIDKSGNFCVDGDGNYIIIGYRTPMIKHYNYESGTATDDHGYTWAIDGWNELIAVEGVAEVATHKMDADASAECEKFLAHIINTALPADAQLTDKEFITGVDDAYLSAEMKAAFDALSIDAQLAAEEFIAGVEDAYLAAEMKAAFDAKDDDAEKHADAKAVATGIEKNGPARQSGQRKPKPCRNFAVGKCTRGSGCWFYHNSADAKAPDPWGNTLQRDDQSISVCTHFARNGTCSFGARCRYRHV